MPTRIHHVAIWFSGFLLLMTTNRALPSETCAHSIFAVAAFSEEAPHMQAAQTPPNVPIPSVALPDGKGKELAVKLCSTCHSTNIWANQHHTAEQWNSIIDLMVSRGMQASDDDIDTISGYLTANFGPKPAETPATPPPGTMMKP
jgi:hypothetical protein